MAVTEVWGVLNVTPDSFSDGGKYVAVETAVSAALAMVNAGAAVIDVGGESTRPGAERVSLEVELQRVIPVVTELARAGVLVSIDTMRAEVAKAAVEAGAKIVNDVSGGKADAEMFKTVAALQCEYVLMHWRGHSDVMQSLTAYQDLTAEVISEWQYQADLAIAAGIAPERLIFDPGIGFSKTATQNWQLIQNLPKMQELPQRILLGVSRKRFLNEVLSADLQLANNPTDRDLPSAMISFQAANLGIFAVRVHDVSSSVSAIRVASAISNGGF